jgi:hypothetical protein
MNVTVAIDTLLQRCLPPRESFVVPTAADVSLLVAGREYPVEIRGLDADLVQISSAGLRLAPAQLLVLRIVLGEGATRIDLAVEVVNAQAEGATLRVHAAPLVLRRRMVRDRALEEAVGMSARRPSLVA